MESILMGPYLLSTRWIHKILFQTFHPDLISLRRMLLTIPSQPSSRKLDQESTFPGRALIHVRDTVTRQFIQTDHFRAIMVDLEPTVVDEVRSKRPIPV